MIQAERRQTKVKDYLFQIHPNAMHLCFPLDRHFLYSLHFKGVSKNCFLDFKKDLEKKEVKNCQEFLP